MWLGAPVGTVTDNDRISAWKGLVSQYEEAPHRSLAGTWGQAIKMGARAQYLCAAVDDAGVGSEAVEKVMLDVAGKLAGGDSLAHAAAVNLLRPIKNGGIGLFPPRVIADVAREAARQRAQAHFFGSGSESQPTPARGDGAQAKEVLRVLGVNVMGLGKVGVAFRTMVSWGAMPVSNATIVTHLRQILDLPASYDGIGDTHSLPCGACGKPMAETTHVRHCWLKGGAVSGHALKTRMHDSVADELARSLRELAGEPVMQRELMQVMPGKHRPDGYVSASKTPSGTSTWFVDVTVVEGDVVAAELAKLTKYANLGVGLPEDPTKLCLPIALNRRGEMGPASSRALSKLGSAAAYLGERKDGGVVLMTIAATIGRALWSNVARRIAAFCDAAGVRPAVPAPAVEPTAGWQRRRHTANADRTFRELLAEQTQTGNQVANTTRNGHGLGSGEPAFAAPAGPGVAASDSASDD